MAARALRSLKYVHYDCDVRVQSEARVFDEADGRLDKRFDAYVEVQQHQPPQGKLLFAVEVIDSSDVTVSSWNAKF